MRRLLRRFRGTDRIGILKIKIMKIKIMKIKIMKIGGIIAAVVLVLAGLVRLGGRDARLPSIESHRGRGLRVCYRYLEERGAEVRPWRRPLAALPEERGLLVVALPLVRGFVPEDVQALDRWLLGGGNVLLLGSGDEPRLAERPLLQGLRLSTGTVEQGLPRGIREWLRWRSSTRLLRSVQRPSAAARVSERAQATVRGFLAPPEPEGWPPELEGGPATHRLHTAARAWVLYEDAAGDAALFAFRERAGRVAVVNDVSLVSNQGLERAGNLALLERLVGWLGGEGTVWFDEWHQGHGVLQEHERASLVGPLEFFALQILLLYVLFAWRLAWPFGPRIVRPHRPTSSVDRDLRVLARLHRRAGHAPEAARALVAWTRREARRRSVPEPEVFPPPPVRGEAAFRRLAREVGRWQQTLSGERALGGSPRWGQGGSGAGDPEPVPGLSPGERDEQDPSTPRSRGYGSRLRSIFSTGARRKSP